MTGAAGRGARRPRPRSRRSGMSVPYPMHPGKHRHPPLFTPAEFHRYEAERGGRPRPRAPRRVIFVFGRRWRTYLDRAYGGLRDPLLDLYRVDHRVGVTVLEGPGAPYAALVVEELAALGTTHFLLFGMAGALSPKVPAGSLVLCTKALRDEGTSRHYVAPARFAFPSPRLTAKLRTALGRAGIAYATGPSWTTDAPYRETVPEIRRYRDDGILTVEMEAAAVFSVARYLGRHAAALFVISDHLNEAGWEPRFHVSRRRLEELLDVTVRALAR